MNPFDEALCQEPFKTEPEPGVEPAFVPTNCRDRGWHETEPVDREWDVDNVLPSGRVGGFFGAGGSGKSRVVSSLVAAKAAATPWFGFTVAKPGAALVVGGEDENAEFHRRVRLAIRDLPEDRQQLAWDRIFFESRVGMDSCLTAVDSASREVRRTAFLDSLIASAKMIPDLRLIILDPLARFRGGDENDSQAATRIVEAAEYLAAETGAAVVLVHHVAKASAREGSSDQHSARGSSALVDGLRFAWHLGPLSLSDIKKFGLTDEGARRFARLTCAKSNYAAAFDPVTLDMSGPIRRVDLEAALSDQAIDTDILDRVQRLIRDKAALGVRFTRSGFVTAFAGEQGPVRASKRKLEPFLQECVVKGLLITRKKLGKGGGEELRLPDEDE